MRYYKRGSLARITPLTEYDLCCINYLLPKLYQQIQDITEPLYLVRLDDRIEVINEFVLISEWECFE